MIASVNKFGPYIVIAPDIAMPHAQSGRGVRETCVSFMKVQRPVCFSDKSEHDARLLFVLASVDNESHLSLLQSLVTKISDDEVFAKLIECQSLEDLQKLC